MKVLVALLSLFIASGALAGENLTADQIWERRAELDKKTVRASFEWHYNFEASDAHVWPNKRVRPWGLGLTEERVVSDCGHGPTAAHRI